MTLIQGMIDGKVNQRGAIESHQSSTKQHIDVSTALVKGVTTEIKVLAIE
jgi:hypothetical protein